MLRVRFLMGVYVVLATLLCTCSGHAVEYAFPLTVTSELNFPRVPMSPEIDFGGMIQEAGLAGVLDPNSITVIDIATQEAVPCAVTEDLSYGDRGHIEWVIVAPERRAYQIRFRTAPARPARMPAACTPRVGVGDLLRYNAGAPRPIVCCYLSGLVDLTGDGKRDLVGCWNYAYRPGWPEDGIICYPRVGDTDAFTFGDLARVRYVDEADSTDYRHFSITYMYADFADFNGDGHVDLVYSPRNGDTLYLYLNSGQRDAGGMPVFVTAGTLARPKDTWSPCRAVDLNQDGAVDLVVGGVYKGDPRASYYLKNMNPDGWPIQAAEPVNLGVEKAPCFFDVDSDGALDAVCLEELADGGVYEARVVWQRNLGGDPPTFGDPQPFESIAPHYPDCLAAVREGPRKGLLVLHDVYQIVTFYEHTPTGENPTAFTPFAKAQSLSAVMSLSDQAWPWPCDWDADGDLDLLVGGGYGWPRIVINDGGNGPPAYREPQFIHAEGKPIKIIRNDVLGEPFNWHNMGYSYPAFIDWDADGLNDLMMPNETNRIFWYRNIGTRQAPKFGPQQQVLVDGYPDSPEARRQSAQRAVDATYPREEERPFFWRTGPGWADWDGNGLLDLVMGDGYTRKLTLFLQYRDEAGTLRLKKAGPLKLADGRLIDWAIVERDNEWADSYDALDWDHDGCIDIVYSLSGMHPAQGSIYLLRNVGSKAEPLFDSPRMFRCYGHPITVSRHGPHAWAGDLDGDGNADLLAGTEWSVYAFYAHAALEMAQHPAYEVGPVMEVDRK